MDVRHVPPSWNFGRATRRTGRRQKIEKANPCVKPTTTSLKCKLTEVNSLFVAGHGGQICEELGTVPVPATGGGGIHRAT